MNYVDCVRKSGRFHGEIDIVKSSKTKLSHDIARSLAEKKTISRSQVSRLLITKIPIKYQLLKFENLLTTLFMTEICINVSVSIVTIKILLIIGFIICPAFSKQITLFFTKIY